eukprot:TRINITY_DN64960_c0_g1_i1.p1 TRINITY_DN64960_c0_g1~~TRINITY_DN64960_c0_g1_i1.p1  ORF type:complete len:547 (+),score=75.84 TRINITY_DN64960_c0_g1_i1:45-1685(+)
MKERTLETVSWFHEASGIFRAPSNASRIDAVRNVVAKRFPLAEERVLVPALDKFNAASLVLFQHVEPFIDRLLPQPENVEIIARDDESDEDQTVSLPKLPMELNPHVCRTFTVKLPKSASLRIAIVCAKDAWQEMISMMSARDVSKMLKKAHFARIQRQRALATDKPISLFSADGAARLASTSCRSILGDALGERLVKVVSHAAETAKVMIVGATGAAGEQCDHADEIQHDPRWCEPTGSPVELREDSKVEEASESGRLEASNSSESTSQTAAEDVDEHVTVRIAVPQNRERAATRDRIGEFRLIVRKTFIEYADEEPQGLGIRRSHSWPHCVTDSDGNAISTCVSKPFTVVVNCVDHGSQPSPSCMISHNAPVRGGSDDCSEPRGNNVDVGDNVVAVPSESVGRTTVQLRNLPAGIKRVDVLTVLDSNGFSGHYNFVYLPIDFMHNSNLGYAMVNLVLPEAAVRFIRHFDGFDRWMVPDSRPCQACWSEPGQTLEEHIERYRNSPVMHHSVPEEHKPALFECGARVAFPAPTKPLRRPRVRHVKA